MTYVQGFLLAVPTERREDYIAMARAAWPIFREYGALEMVENWGVDVPEGATTSLPMAVRRRPEETVVFSWIIWQDRSCAEACSASMDTDARWRGMPEMCFDGERMMWGFFEPAFSATA